MIDLVSDKIKKGAELVNDTIKLIGGKAID